MQPSWMQVNRCIRHVFTWGTGSVSFHSGHSAHTHTYGNMTLQVPITLLYSSHPFLAWESLQTPSHHPASPHASCMHLGLTLVT